MYIARRGKELFNHCKLCGNEQLYDKADNCVYRSDFKNSFMSSKTMANKYIKFDPTLPRITNIICPNDACITNQKKHYFKDKILISNMSYVNSTRVSQLLPTQIESIYGTLDDLPDFEDVEGGGSGSGGVVSGAVGDDDVDDAAAGAVGADDSSLVKMDGFNIETLLHNKILVTVKGKQIKPLIALLRKEPFIKKNKVSVKKCPKPEKEVIFIKYDKANMRYLYYCCYCDTNWKNV